MVEDKEELLRFILDQTNSYLKKPLSEKQKNLRRIHEITDWIVWKIHRKLINKYEEIFKIDFNDQKQ